MPDVTSVPDDIRDYVFCSQCGGVRTLVDLRAEAAKLGLNYPTHDPHYTVECCGYTLAIEDNETFDRVIEAIKRLNATS